MLANHVYAHLLLLLQPSVLWLSIVTVTGYVKPPGTKVNFARIWCIMNPTPTNLGYLSLKRWHGKIWPQLRRLPNVADRATHLEDSPHLSCKRDQVKMRDYLGYHAYLGDWKASRPLLSWKINYLLTKELFWVLSFRYLLFMNSCHKSLIICDTTDFLRISFFWNFVCESLCHTLSLA